MNFKIFKQMVADKIRGICIEHDLYTVGDNDAYSAMFNKATQKTASSDEFDELVFEVAKDILQHSETDMPIDSVMFYLYNEATVITVE